MTVQELYDHIIKHMTAEQALKNMLQASLVNYKTLKFNEGEEIHPVMLIVMAAQEMGWGLAIKSGKDDEEVNGITTGNQEYLDEIFATKPDCCTNNCQCND